MKYSFKVIIGIILALTFLVIATATVYQVLPFQ